MKKSITSQTLSDGSIVFNLIIADPSIKTQICFHCRDYESAVLLSKTLSDTTVDFEME